MHLDGNNRLSRDVSLEYIAKLLVAWLYLKVGFGILQHTLESLHEKVILYLFTSVSSADLCKQFGPSSGSTKCQP